MCLSCGSQEDLRIPIPEELDEQLVTEYVNARDTNSINQMSVFDYFNKIYKVQYIFNPKQLRRAIVNMDKIYYDFKHGYIIFNKDILEGIEDAIEEVNSGKNKSKAAKKLLDELDGQ